MILLDHQPLNLNNPSTGIEKAVKARIKEIKESGKVFTIKDPSPRKFSDSGRPHNNSPIQFRLKTGQVATWFTEVSGKLEEFTGVWAQCDIPPKMNKDGVYDYSPSLVRILEEQTYSCEKNAEKVFFIKDLFKPERVGLVVEDKDDIAKEKNERRRLRASVEFMIFSGEKLTEEDIIKLAYSVGINAEGLSPDVLKDELFNTVERSEKDKLSTGYGFKEFIRDAEKMDKTVELKSDVQIAIERNLVSADQIKGWTYANGTRICLIPADKWDRRKDVLVNKLSTDKDALEMFTATMGKPSKKKDTSLKGEIESLSEDQLRPYVDKNYPNRFFPATTKPETIRNWLLSQI